MDEGGAGGEETDSAGEGGGEGGGGAPRRPGSVAAGGARGSKDEELKRLQDEVRLASPTHSSVCRDATLPWSNPFRHEWRLIESLESWCTC